MPSNFLKCSALAGIDSNYFRIFLPERSVIFFKGTFPTKLQISEGLYSKPLRHLVAKNELEKWFYFWEFVPVPWLKCPTLEMFLGSGCNKKVLNYFKFQTVFFFNFWAGSNLFHQSVAHCEEKDSNKAKCSKSLKPA